MTRIDLTEWCTHFIHRPDPDLRRQIRSMDRVKFIDLPTAFAPNGEPIYVEPLETPKKLEKTETAYDVLLNILYDGYIKSSWSIRRPETMNKSNIWSLKKLGASIYGPNSCVCFTEMPLYAFKEYTEQHKYAEFFGIAAKRKALYHLGARPVVYGLKNTALAVEGDENYMQHAQNLAKDSGLSLSEQYRYVVTVLKNRDDGAMVDWTHEREWRWADTDSHAKENFIPGLGIFIRGLSPSLKEFVLFVDSDKRIKPLLAELAELSEMLGENNQHFYTYKSKKIWILSLSELERQMEQKKNPYMRLDDIDLNSLPRFHL